VKLRVILLIISFNGILAQNATKKWFFGNGAGLDFMPFTPTVIVGGALTSSLGCASIADSNGNLLFYTDGATVYNSTHSVMANGSGLNGGGVAQSAMIIKRPLSNNSYFVFSLQSGGLYYSEVDVTLAAGSGSLIVKNAPLFIGSCSQQMTSTKHCNGTDYWLLAICGGSFHAFAVTSAGVGTLAAISTPTGVLYGLNGCMKLSPNGRKLAVTSTDAPSPSSTAFSKVSLFDFDNINGVVHNGVYVNNPPNFLNNILFSYGCEFSQDGSKLYYDYSGLRQYDLCSVGPPNNGLLIYSNNDGVTVNTSLKRSFQLASNGKIYITLSPTSSSSPVFVPTNSLALINFPNLAGGACLFNPIGQSIGSYSAQWGLPNFPGSYFEQRPTPNFTNSANSDVGCLTNTFFPAQICSSTGYSVIGYQWNFGDPASGPANTSFLINPVHSYSATGIYTVQLIRNFTCFSDTIVKPVFVTLPSLNVLSQSTSCGIATATALISGGYGPYNYTWTPSGHTTAIVSLTNPGGIYTISVKDIGGGCLITNTINIPNTILNSSISVTPPLCHNMNNGTATISVLGGSGSYTYTWTGVAQNSNTVNGLSFGSYTVTIQDLINLCISTKTFVMSQPSPLTSAMVSAFGSTCVGYSIPIWANVSGGTPPYQYLWINGPAAQVFTVSQNVTGTYVYSLSIVDSHSCAASNTIAVNFVNFPSLIVPSVSVCFQNQVNLVASGASSYTWMPGSFFGNPFQISPASSAIYTVTGDSLGCSSSATVQVTVLAKPGLTLNVNSPLCVGQTLLLNTISNGNSFQWSGPSGFSAVSQSTTIVGVSLLNSGIYTVIASGNNSCSAQSTINVSVFPNPVLSISGNSIICYGEATTLSANGASSYTWNTGQTINSILINPIQTTTYTVSGSIPPIGCTSIQSYTVKLYECTNIDEEGFSGSSVKLYPNPNGGNFSIRLSTLSEVTVIDVLGRSVYSTNMNAGTSLIELVNINPGVYFINIKSREKSDTFKVIIE